MRPDHGVARGRPATDTARVSTPTNAPTESELFVQLRPHLGLFTLLCLATFFEGFDTQLSSLVQPMIRNDFGVSVEAVGTALGLSRLGMVAAFFVILMADRVGRRPIFLAGLAGYAVFTLATAFATDLVTFAILQFFASGAMVVELFLAYVILSEALPTAVRGRVNGLFASTAAIGAAVPAGLLAPLESLDVGWRGLFVLGAIPLLLLPIYIRRIPETSLFEAQRRSQQSQGPRSSAREAWREFFASLRTLWRSSARGRLLRVSLLWLAVNFWSGSALYSFTFYVYDDHGWTAADLAWLPLGTIPIGALGYVLSGVAMDRYGRRRAAIGYLLVATIATLVCYRATHTAVIYGSYFALVGLVGVWTIVTTWTAELFATASRATAIGVANNLIGRLGLVVGPISSGLLAGAFGSFGDAISLLAIAPVLAIPIALSLPETRHLELDEVVDDAVPRKLDEVADDASRRNAV